MVFGWDRSTGRYNEADRKILKARLPLAQELQSLHNESFISQPNLKTVPLLFGEDWVILDEDQVEVERSASLKAEGWSGANIIRKSAQGVQLIDVGSTMYRVLNLSNSDTRAPNGTITVTKIIRSIREEESRVNDRSIN